MQYEEIPPVTKADAECIVAQGRVEDLVRAVVGVALFETDMVWAEDFSVRLAKHQDRDVRGCAIMAFGHLARRGHTLNRAIVTRLLREALQDPDDSVRGHAHDAASDMEFFLGWTIE